MFTKKGLYIPNNFTHLRLEKSNHCLHPADPGIIKQCFEHIIINERRCKTCLASKCNIENAKHWFRQQKLEKIDA